MTGNRLTITSNQDTTKRNIKHDGNKNTFIIDIIGLTENLFFLFVFSEFLHFLCHLHSYHLYMSLVVALVFVAVLVAVVIDLNLKIF